MNPTEDELEAWIRKGWDTPPMFTRETLRQMYRDEQARHAAREAEDWRTREVVELRARVAALERVLGPAGKGLIGVIAKGFGKALGEARERDREHILGEVEKRGYARYGGTWDEGVDYPRGAMVTHAGSVWVATGPVAKGARPGRAAEWRLAAEGDAHKPPVVA